MIASLEISNLRKSFGGLTALRNVNLTMKPGEIRGLIGPNGAGKTTLINVITGVLRPDTGIVKFGNEDLTKLTTHQIAQRGVVRTFQSAEPFSSLTALENVMVGRHIRGKSSLLSSVLRLRRQRAEEQLMAETARTGLRIVGLESLQGRQAGGLAFGQLRLLEIARALAAEPQVLLLDEPAAGMNSEEVNALIDLVQKLRHEHRLTILLIEHNIDFVMSTSDLVTVLNHGVVIADGNPSEVRDNPEVVEAYTGHPMQKKTN